MLPVCSDDALGDSVSYLVENVSVVCTADEELILKNKQTSINEELPFVLVSSHIYTLPNEKKSILWRTEPAKIINK